jgi:hypothetical protein
VLKRDSIIIGVMLHGQQNDERSAERAGIEGEPTSMDLHCEVVWPKVWANMMAGAARRERRRYRDQFSKLRTVRRWESVGLRNDSHVVPLRSKALSLLVA